MRLTNTTKMACQAALSVMIAEFIAWYFSLERGYWTTLTAMSLTTQTWGESIKRALERISMTILGGITGTLFYFLFPHTQLANLSILMTFTFFMVYFYQIYYRVAVFALTGFVVFLFAILGSWTIDLLLVRIFDTILGAVIAVVVSRLFLPNKTNITELFDKYLYDLKASLATVFLSRSLVNYTVSSQKLAVDFQKIRNNALSIRYEMMFQRMSSHTFHLVLHELIVCTEQAMSSFEAYRWLVLHLSKKDKLGVEKALQYTLHNIDVLQLCLHGDLHGIMYPARYWMILRDDAIAEDPKQFGSFKSEVLGFFNLMYFFIELNKSLNVLHRLLRNLPEK